MKSVLVTGIGGNVGQGILRNIKHYFPEIKIIGTDISDFTVGSRYCDAFFTVPFAGDASYIPLIVDICLTENINLIIPSTDLETFYLGIASEKLPQILASPSLTTSTCLDKYKTYQHFYVNDIPFAESILPSLYNFKWKDIIVKPREGRGSRSIFLNPSSLEQFNDSYIVQEQLIGPEITTAIYVTRENKLHGHITFKRTLNHGMTSCAEVTLDYDDEIKNLTNKIIKSFRINGPCNIQSIVTKNGVIPFELNCRYSGTNSIRSQFGFEDVKYGLEEYLYNNKPTIPKISSGTAIRMYMDVIYKDEKLSDLNVKSDSYIF